MCDNIIIIVISIAGICIMYIYGATDDLCHNIIQSAKFDIIFSLHCIRISTTIHLLSDNKVKDSYNSNFTCCYALKHIGPQQIHSSLQASLTNRHKHNNNDINTV